MTGERQVERVVVLALDGVYPFELGIPSRIFGAADGRYEVLTCSVDGQPVRTNADFTIGVAHGPEILATADTVVVASVTPSHIPAELPVEVATALARRCVVPPFRDGGQAQYIEQPVPESGAAGTAATRAWALEHLDEPLTLAALAGHARMSLRTFARRFNDEVGLSPGRWLIRQ